MVRHVPHLFLPLLMTPYKNYDAFTPSSSCGSSFIASTSSDKSQMKANLLASQFANLTTMAQDMQVTNED